MMTLFSFLKPYRLSCFFIVLIVLADVGGSLLIPAITANMINLAVIGKGLDRILDLGVMMLAITVASGTLTLLGSWLSARLSANVGRDMRNAIYDRSLQFSSSDFETFGTASMLTRTLNDVGVIQQGLTDFV
jgi:ATP-binding cassette subfamily B multidrug efflux pump